MEARLAASPAERRPDHPFRGACGAAAPGLGCAAPGLRWASLGGAAPGRSAGAEPRRRRRRPPPLHPLLFRPAPLRSPPPPLPLAALTARPVPRRPPPPLSYRHFLRQAGAAAAPPAAGAAPPRARPLRAAAQLGRGGPGTGASRGALAGGEFFISYACALHSRVAEHQRAAPLPCLPSDE